jgi:NADPH2:quinone reductase
MAMPSGLGVEAAGVVEAIGEGVTDYKIGDRVCTFGLAVGAYATARNLPANMLFHVPDDITDETSAAALLKGCTTEFLVERCATVRAGDAVLVHAAAGGVGLLLVQWLKHRGATVIGSVSTEEKADIARAAGADHIINYATEDTAARCRDLTGGKGVRTAFDGVGMDTWEASLKSCQRRGLIISYGNASGPVTGVDLRAVANAGSLFITRPTLYDYYVDPVERAAGAAMLFDMIRKGVVSVDIRQRYALADVAQAHRDLEARKTTGSTIFLP